jgi:hypothetical protein
MSVTLGVFLRLPKTTLSCPRWEDRLTLSEIFCLRDVNLRLMTYKTIHSKGLSFCGSVARELPTQYSLETRPRGGLLHMANRGPKGIVDEHCAAVLLGLTPPELRWFSRVLGLGFRLESENASHIFFTYEELKRLSCAAAASAK